MSDHTAAGSVMRAQYKCWAITGLLAHTLVYSLSQICLTLMASRHPHKGTLYVKKSSTMRFIMITHGEIHQQ